jgi:hypothetical protein
MANSTVDTDERIRGPNEHAGWHPLSREEAEQLRFTTFRRARRNSRHGLLQPAEALRLKWQPASPKNKAKITALNHSLPCLGKLN